MLPPSIHPHPGIGGTRCVEFRVNVQGTDSTKQESRVRFIKRKLSKSFPRAHRGLQGWGVQHRALEGAAGCVTSPSTVTFRVLEPGGVTPPARGDIIQERGIRWPLLCHPQSSRVPHGKVRRGVGAGRNSISEEGWGEGRKGQGPQEHPGLVLSSSGSITERSNPVSAMGVHMTLSKT